MVSFGIIGRILFGYLNSFNTVYISLTGFIFCICFFTSSCNSNIIDFISFSNVSLLLSSITNGRVLLNICKFFLESIFIFKKYPKSSFFKQFLNKGTTKLLNSLIALIDFEIKGSNCRRYICLPSGFSK